MTTDIDKFKALFCLAGIGVSNVHQLENGYWPPAYDDMRKRHPWALMVTPYGNIKIGWRKRVIQIDWTDTKLRKNIVSEEEGMNVTNDNTFIHAWSYAKALEYLSTLHRELERLQSVSNVEQKT